MDLLTAITTAGTILGPAVVKIIQDVWEDYRAGRRQRQGLIVDPRGLQQEIPYVSGAFAVPASSWHDVDYEDAYEGAPIVMMGQFLFEDSFVDWAEILLDEEDEWVMFLAIDQESEEIYFFDFGFEGYAISLWPGLYSFYAFVVDPILDDVLGFGYPCCEDLDDPNPVEVTGQGVLELDFFVFDSAEE